MVRASVLNNPFRAYLKSLKIGENNYKYYNLTAFGEKYRRLPFSIRVLLENAVRNCDNTRVKEEHVDRILNWEKTTSSANAVEIPFKPTRLLLDDLTGVPVLVDFANMRGTVKRLGGDPSKINPMVPTDVVVDHSVVVDFARTPDARKRNEEIEFKRNRERFAFLKWGASALNNISIVPPGNGIMHQVNMELFARVVSCDGDFFFPDTVVGTDSHIPMINSLGILGWGVGGIEAVSVMCDLPLAMILPPVIGCNLIGELSPDVTVTDLLLTITKQFREVGVVGKFVEFFGPGVAHLSFADRASISNMCPEYGCTVCFFPVDNLTLQYLRETNRPEEKIKEMEVYLKRNLMMRDFDNPNEDPVYSEEISFDLASVVPSVSGPKRPHDLVALTDMPRDFHQALTNKIGFKGFGVHPDEVNSEAVFEYEGRHYTLKHGSVILAAITSCTNTGHTSLMFGAGLLAKKAVEYGLSVRPYIKTSLSPGSKVVTTYLEESGLMRFMDSLGFNVVGYGCMTCIGNSGQLPKSVIEAFESKNLVCCSVLSGNRNYDGRVHRQIRANYLTSPQLVVAYAIAGRIDIDFDSEPLGQSTTGEPVYLRDIWPLKEEIRYLEERHIKPLIYKRVYSKIYEGNEIWRGLETSRGDVYPWDPSSTYIQPPPFFKTLTKECPIISPILGARVLVKLGDSVSTDHISPAGVIAPDSPAAKYLMSVGVKPSRFNSYGARRGNDEVMVRGTFANDRLVNQFMDLPCPRTMHIPSGDAMSVYEASRRYRKEKVPLVVLAGKEFGSGSSRDWAAKGPFLLGIRAIFAESFERISRSNLAGMGILPLQFLPGQCVKSLRLTGLEQYTIRLHDDISPFEKLTVETDDDHCFQVIARLDTGVDVTYFRHGGLMNYIIRTNI